MAHRTCFVVVLACLTTELSAIPQAGLTNEAKEEVSPPVRRELPSAQNVHRWVRIQSCSLRFSWSDRFSIAINKAVTAYGLSLTLPDSIAEISKSILHNTKYLHHEFLGLSPGQHFWGKLEALVGPQKWPYQLLNFTIETPLLLSGREASTHPHIDGRSFTSQLENVKMGVKLQWAESPFAIGNKSLPTESRTPHSYILKIWEGTSLIREQKFESSAARGRLFADHKIYEMDLEDLFLDKIYKVTLEGLMEAPHTGMTISFHIDTGSLIAEEGVRTTGGVQGCYSALQVRCPNSDRCVSPYWICDGSLDCPDGADEQGCEETPTCDGGFHCYGSKDCLPSFWRCDGFEDCLDGEDEVGCSNCEGDDLLRCGSGSDCVSSGYACDGQIQCADGWDESEAVCNKDGHSGSLTSVFNCSQGSVQCGKERTCVRISSLCDHNHQCPQGEDEHTMVCSLREYLQQEHQEQQQLIKEENKLTLRQQLENQSQHHEQLLLQQQQKYQEEMDAQKKEVEDSKEMMKMEIKKQVEETFKEELENEIRNKMEKELMKQYKEKLKDEVKQKIEEEHKEKYEKEIRRKLEEQTRKHFEEYEKENLEQEMMQSFKEQHKSKFKEEIQKKYEHKFEKLMEVEETELKGKNQLKIMESTPYTSTEPVEEPATLTSTEEFKTNPILSTSTLPIIANNSIPTSLEVSISSTKSIIYEEPLDKPSSCPSDEFDCGDGWCVPVFWLCDGRLDCINEEDENPKTCALFLDGIEESESEYNHPNAYLEIGCTADEYKCDLGPCISKTLLCDGNHDCPHADDEDYIVCPTTTTVESIICKSDEYKCMSGPCIPKSKLCDGSYNCPNADDEDNVLCFSTTVNPIKCKYDEFQCNAGPCISKSLLCDGVMDCPNAEDEDNSNCITTTKKQVICNDDQYKCNSGPCIAKSNLCDGYLNCPDGDDESYQNCPTSTASTIHCSSDEYLCISGSCIPRSMLCDGIDNCPNADDEDSSICTNTTDGWMDRWTNTTENPILCQADEYKCNDSGPCIPKSMLCDGIYNCPNADDEDSSICTNTTDKPIICQADEYKCNDSGLCIPKSMLCDGNYNCPNAEDEDSSICTNTTENSIICQTDEYKCNDSGLCIPKSMLCDGDYNCPNADDENSSQCNTTRETPIECKYDEFKCKSGICILRSMLCDGSYDCPSADDEDNLICLNATEETRECFIDEYRCKSSSCIPKAFLCDGTYNCLHGDDEDNTLCRIILHLLSSTQIPTIPEDDSVPHNMTQASIENVTDSPENLTKGDQVELVTTSETPTFVEEDSSYDVSPDEAMYTQLEPVELDTSYDTPLFNLNKSLDSANMISEFNLEKDGDVAQKTSSNSEDSTILQFIISENSTNIKHEILKNETLEDYPIDYEALLSYIEDLFNMSEDYDEKEYDLSPPLPKDKLSEKNYQKTLPRSQNCTNCNLKDIIEEVKSNYTNSTLNTKEVEADEKIFKNITTLFVPTVSLNTTNTLSVDSTTDSIDNSLIFDDIVENEKTINESLGEQFIALNETTPQGDLFQESNITRLVDKNGQNEQEKAQSMMNTSCVSVSNESTQVNINEMHSNIQADNITFTISGMTSDDGFLVLSTTTPKKSFSGNSTVLIAVHAGNINGSVPDYVIHTTEGKLIDYDIIQIIDQPLQRSKTQPTRLEGRGPSYFMQKIITYKLESNGKLQFKPNTFTQPSNGSRDFGHIHISSSNCTLNKSKSHEQKVNDSLIVESERNYTKNESLYENEMEVSSNLNGSILEKDLMQELEVTQATKTNDTSDKSKSFPNKEPEENFSILSQNDSLLQTENIIGSQSPSTTDEFQDFFINMDTSNPYQEEFENNLESLNQEGEKLSSMSPIVSSPDGVPSTTNPGVSSTLDIFSPNGKPDNFKSFDFNALEDYPEEYIGGPHHFEDEFDLNQIDNIPLGPKQTTTERAEVVPEEILPNEQEYIQNQNEISNEITFNEYANSFYKDYDLSNELTHFEDSNLIEPIPADAIDRDFIRSPDPSLSLANDEIIVHRKLFSLLLIFIIGYIYL